MEGTVLAHAADEGSNQDGNGEHSRDEAKKPKKRTKTGCFTCRKRRIKCDEQKPQCNNCIKSHRVCEGYQQPFQFKQPLDQSAWASQNQSRLPLSHANSSNDQSNHPSSYPQRTFAEGSFDYRQQQPGTSRQRAPFARPTPPQGVAWNRQVAPVTGTPLSPPRVVSAPGMSLSPDQIGMPLITSLAQGALSSQPTRPQHMSEDTMQNPIYGTESGISYLHAPWINNDLGQPPAPAQPSMVGQFDKAGSTEHRAPRPYWQLPTTDATFPRFRSIGFQREGNDTRTLASHIWSAHNTVLQNQELRDTYMHFLRVTGPLLSLYERPPYTRSHEGRTSSIFSWNYTLPQYALKYPVLLHAILALSGLQQAKLQNIPIEPCLKQYHYSVNRLRQNLKSSFHNGLIPALAASLLLGYFEVWMGRHTSWCRHLLGTSLLLSEQPLQSMAQKYLPAKRRKVWAGLSAGSISQRSQGGVELYTLLDDYDYGLLSTLLGYVITPEEYGLGQPRLEETPDSVSDADIERYESIRDLIWWYNKLDVYQAILGGSKLLRSWNLWIQCPPRAGHSLRNAVYGTFDHVVLLLGRMADFAARDLPRKRKAASTTAGPGPPTSSPQFPGIVPTGPNVTAPRGFSASRNESPQTVANEETDSSMSFNEAVSEWEDIRQAFQVLGIELQDAFAQLPEELSDGRPTPFGRPLQYSSFEIAGLWMNYYMGMIQLHRCHPRMPPAAIPASQIADAETRQYANLIGKIAAGLSHDIPKDRTHVDAKTGAAFIESTFSLFVAGIQLKDDSQRRWVVGRMLDIVRLMGWQTGFQIALALETGWIKMYQFGRGPEYVKSINNQATDPGTPLANPRRSAQQTDDPEAEKNRMLPNADRAKRAMGIIAIEEDLRDLEFGDD